MALRQTLACSAALLLVHVSCRADQAEQVADLVQPLIDKDQIVGCVVGVFDAGRKQVYGFGEIARGGRKKPDGRTIYEIGSMTKAFTGTVLADMVERGEAKLDDPLADYLPPGSKPPKANGRPITLLDLATHTAGLPKIPDNMPFADPANPYADYDAKLLYAFLADYQPPKPPGAYAYSNLGVGLLGTLLATRAGKSYEQLVVERIAQPLAMSDTKIQLTPADRLRLAPPYDRSLKRNNNWDFDALAGCGAIRSTADDCLKLVDAALTEDAQLTKLPADQAAVVRALRAAWQPHYGKPGETGVGLCWHIHPDGVTRWHNGKTGGYASCMFAVPKRRLAVVVLANTATDQIDELGLKLTTSLVGGDVEPVQMARQAQADDAGLKKFVGKYNLSPTFSIAITLEEGGLVAQATGQGKLNLSAVSPNRFRVKELDAEISFVEKRGKVVSLILHQNGVDQPGVKAAGIPPKERRTVKVAPAILKTYVGSYELAPDFAINITAEGDRLFAQATGQERLELSAQTPVRFFNRALDAEIGFVKKRGKVVGLILRQNGVDQRAAKKAS